MVNIIHHAFSVAETTHDDPRIVGVTGNRKTSALKSFDPTIATKNLNPMPKATCLGAEKKVPSIQQFLSVSSAQGFQALSGDEDGELISTLSKYPNLFWIHGTVFEVLEGKASLRADNAAMRILTQIKAKGSSTNKDGSNDDEEEPDNPPANAMQKSCHPLLSFLWGIANGFGQNVALTDPPGTEIFHAKGQEVMEEILAARPHMLLTPPQPIPLPEQLVRAGRPWTQQLPYYRHWSKI
jgi:hypothetical protein